MLAHDLASKSDLRIRAIRGSKNRGVQGSISRTPFGSVLLIERFSSGFGGRKKAVDSTHVWFSFASRKIFTRSRKGKKKSPPHDCQGQHAGGGQKKNIKEKSPPGNANGTTWRASFDLREEQIIGTQDEAQKLVAQRLLVILHCLDSTNSS